MKFNFEMTAPATPPQSSGPTILVVDDDPAIRQILVRLLSEENYQALTAANGVEALALADTAKLDLVLLDLNMPVKDGWETFEQLIAQDPLRPVILITAHPNQFFPALASGAGALLEKPLDFTQLFQTIRALLKEREQLRRAHRSNAFTYVPSVGKQRGHKHNYRS
jgi:two-component system nitrogen regulation response regulator NtrX